jgi:hypothetical protein
MLKGNFKTVGEDEWFGYNLLSPWSGINLPHNHHLNSLPLSNADTFTLLTSLPHSLDLARRLRQNNCYHCHSNAIDLGNSSS